MYGALLNHRTAFDALAGQFDQPPLPRSAACAVIPVHKATQYARDPRSRRRNYRKWLRSWKIGACGDCVLGRTATRVSETNALDYIAGFIVVNDVSVPHPNYYRPSIRYKARDGFCPLGPMVTPRSKSGDPRSLGIRTYVDGLLIQAVNTADLIRSAARLLADVSAFMTLAPGDVLAAGAAAPAPRVCSGQTVTIEIDGLGRLTNHFVAAVV